MSEFPLGYERIAPTTWIYLSSLLMFGVFFKFNRVWSVRNLDLVLLVLLAPGLLMVQLGQEKQQQARLLAEETAASIQHRPPPNHDSATKDESENDDESTADEAENESDAIESAPEDASIEQLAGPSSELQASGVRLERAGFSWLLIVTALLLVRMLVDSMMVRRPLLEPNLSIGGLTFIGCSLFVFLMANVITGRPTPADLDGPRRSEQLVDRVPSADAGKDLSHTGPGYPFIFLPPTIATVWRDGEPAEAEYATISRVMAITAHLAIVLGIVVIGYRHFANHKTGVGVAMLYLMLPYTAQMTGYNEHVIPAALLVWGVACYRRPLVSGVFIGLACGVVYYALFLLPLWISFYWRRGWMRFLIGVVSMLAVLALSLVFISTDAAAYWSNVRKMFGLWWPRSEGLQGIWGLGWDPVYRLPILAAFIALSGTFALWPAQKNLGTLLSCTAAVMLATQFWHGFGGGLFIAWYLPLGLLTVFRPNLEDRVAVAVLDASSFSLRRRSKARKAA